jgi:hypothetical protein
MNGTQQISGDLPIIQDRVCDPWQLAHSARMSSRRSVTVQGKGPANSTRNARRHDKRERRSLYRPEAGRRLYTRRDA